MIGLEIKASKSEVVNLNLDAVDFQKALEKIQSILKEVQVTALEKLVMLGAPIFSPAVKASLTSKHFQLLKMIDRLSYLSTHQTFFLLKNCLAIPKLLFILRCSSSYHEHALLKKNMSKRLGKELPKLKPLVSLVLMLSHFCLIWQNAYLWLKMRPEKLNGCLKVCHWPLFVVSS